MVVWLRLKLNTKICAGNGKTAGINLFFDLQKVADSISVVEEGLGNKFLQKLQLKGVDRWDILWCKPSPGRAWTVRRRAVWRIVAKEPMFLCIEKTTFHLQELREELQARQHMGGVGQQHGCGNGCGKTAKIEWVSSSKGLSRIEGPLLRDMNQIEAIDDKRWLMSWSICSFQQRTKWLTCLRKEASFGWSHCAGFNIKRCPNLGMVGSSAKLYIFHNWIPNPHVFWADIMLQPYHHTTTNFELVYAFPSLTFEESQVGKTKSVSHSRRWLVETFIEASFEIFHQISLRLPSSQKAFSDSWKDISEKIMLNLEHLW